MGRPSAFSTPSLSTPFTMKTYVYIDGFNLYYGCIKDKGAAYKWLDLRQLFTTVLGNSYDIAKIKYYTARVSSRPGDIDGPTNQNAYLNALKAHIPDLDIILGHFLTNTVRMPLANPTAWSKTAEVIKTEEKGSDVNLAVHLVNDAWLNRFECAVIVSNDSDLAESLRLVKKKHKKIVLIPPGDPAIRPPSIQLKRWSHKVLSIPLADIANSQLPDAIPNTTIRKPKSW